MAKQKVKPAAAETRKPVTFGGSMIRDVSGIPGLLENFVTVSRRYSKADFEKHGPAMAAAFAHLNAETLVDDLGSEWGPETLLHLGTDGVDTGQVVAVVHKFLPVDKLYSAVSFKFTDDGQKF